MSLTSFIKIPEIRAEILELWPLPQFSLDSQLLAPPLSKNYATIGTAFDYLFRFYLKYHYPKCVESEWVAEHSVNPIFLHELFEQQATLRGLNSKERADFEALEALHGVIGESIIKKAKKEKSKFIETGQLTDELIRSAIELAKLDAIFRGGYIFTDIKKLTETSAEDIQDIRKLFEIIPKNVLTAKKEIFLNQTFPKASELVGGADCDIIMDGDLIDIKTTKNLELTKDHWTQLIGYATLADIARQTNKFPEITSISIYYSRHAIKWSHPTSKIYDHLKYQNFKKWFTEQANKVFKQVK